MDIEDAEKEKILQEAKKLMDEFGGKLEKIKVKEEHFVSVENPEGVREEGTGAECDSEFRDLMMLNAGFVEDDCIVAEKGDWKK